MISDRTQDIYTRTVVKERRGHVIPFGIFAVKADYGGDSGKKKNGHDDQGSSDLSCTTFFFCSALNQDSTDHPLSGLRAPEAVRVNFCRYDDRWQAHSCLGGT